MTMPSKKMDPGDPVDPVEILVQYEFVQLLTEHLADCWQVFDGDFGEMIVLAVLGQAYLSPLLREKDPAQVFSSRPRALSASRLSDVSRIPRQTVRRKLAQLKEKGWVVEDESACLSLAIADGRAPVRDALDDLHRRGYARAKRLAVALKPYV